MAGRTLLTDFLTNTTATTSNTITDISFLGGVSIQGTNDEVSAQNKIYTDGTIDNFFTSIASNSVAATSTVKVRKNTADTTLVINVTSSQTGKLEDVTHTDTITAGDVLNFRWTPGSTSGTATFNGCSVEYIVTVNTGSMNTPLGYTNSNGMTTATGASTNYFFPINGQFTSSNGGNTTEGLTQGQMENAGTFSNLNTKVKTNSRTTTTTVTFRKNGADTAMTVNYTSTQTGLKEDLSNTVSVAVGDKVNYSLVNGTGTLAITWTGIGCVFTIPTTTGPSLWVSANVVTASDVIPTSTTRPMVVQGRSWPSQSPESDNQLKIRGVYHLSDLNINIGSNSVTAASTFVLRDTAVNTALTIPITASTTGIFRDITHTYTTTATSLLNYNFTTGATGTSLFVGTITMLAESATIYSYTPSEAAISVAQTLIKMVTHPLIQAAISVAQTLVKKIFHSITTEPSITAAAATIVRKVIRPILATTVTVGASSLVRNAMRFSRTTAAEPSITVAQTLRKMVTHPISEPAISAIASLKKKVSHTVTAEPAITVAQTLLRKSIRTVSEPAISTAQSILKKITHPLSEIPIIPIVTIARKITRPFLEPSITISQILNKMYKAIRPFSEPSNISVSSSSPVIKLYRTIVEPLKTITDSILVESPTSHLITEPSVVVLASTLVKKISHFIVEPIVNNNNNNITDTYTLFRVIRPIFEPVKTITDSFTARKISHFLTNEPAKTITGVLASFKMAIRSLTNITVIGPSTLTKTTFNFRNISNNEPAINNVVDTLDGHHRQPITIVEPLVNISDTPATVNRKYIRSISEVPPIRVNDILNTDIILAFEIHLFKQGRRFLLKRPEDTNLALEDKHKL